MQADAEDKMATFYKMTLCPNQSGYSGTVNYGKLRIQLEGGRSRFRQEYRNQANTVNVSWMTDKNGYDYLVAFRSLYSKQSNPFLIDLILDDSELVEYKADFIGALNLTKVEGLSYTVTTELEVSAKRRSNDSDEVIVLGVLDLVNPLEKLVNVDLPNALENLP